MRNILSVAVAEHGAAWAIAPERLRAWASLDAADVPSSQKRRGGSRKGLIGVMPIFGIITQRGGGLLDVLFGGTSTEAFGRAFDQMVADDSVDAILIDIDSPGGSVFGVGELAEKIYTARGRKPVVALADSVAESAAYWLGTAADKLYVTPGGQVGSVGVWQAHVDESGALDRAGLKVSLISAGKYKVEGNPWEPLTDEARGTMQREVDGYYAQFVDAVAKHRGVSPSRVSSGYGQGRVLLARDALAAGMVDGVATFEQTVSRLSRRGNSFGPESAATRRRNLAAALLAEAGVG